MQGVAEGVRCAIKMLTLESRANIVGMESGHLRRWLTEALD